ncbi:MAG: hypothetical protein WDM80_07360 [Limisphaerales bacterium]
MKKSIFFAALGLATVGISSFGQGFVAFSSYYANNGAGAITTLFGSGNPIPAGYTADLYYALGTVADPINYSSASSIISVPAGLTDLGFTANYLSGPKAGYFDGGIATIPGYTGGPITFEVVAYNGSSYASSTWRARSGSFTMNSIAIGASPAPALGNNGQMMPTSSSRCRNPRY